MLYLYNNIDIVIFISFLLINLVVGLYYGRGVKNINDYALGGRNFSTMSLTFTIIGTWIGGGVLSKTLAETYRQGLYFIFPIIGDSLVLLCIGYFLAPRVLEFIGDKSIAESMGKLYGLPVKYITAAMSVAVCIGAVAVQFKVSSSVIQLFFGISSFYAVILSCIIVVLYSSFGGIRSITYTDVIQVFTFCTIIPIIALVILKSLDSQEQVFSVLNNNPLFDFNEFFSLNNKKFLASFFLFLFYVIPTLEPAIFQRMSMAKNSMQIKKAFSVAAFIGIGVSMVICWTSILILSKDSTLNPNTLLPYIIDNYSYTGLKGIIAICIMAIIMSTADSYINSAAVILSDIFFTSNKETNAVENRSLIFVRITSIFIGVVAFFVAFNTKTLLDLTLLIWGAYMPIITVPLMLAIFGFRSTTVAVVIGMIGGLCTLLIWNYYFAYFGINSVIPGMLGNLVFFIGSHYILKQSGGWVGIKDSTILNEIRKSRKRRIHLLIKSIKDFNILKFCEHHIPQNDSTYVAFGLFSVISTMSNVFLLGSGVTNIEEFLLQIVLVLSTCIITYPIWSYRIGYKYRNVVIGLLWNVSMFYILGFANTFLLLVKKPEAYSIILFTVNLLVVALLNRVKVAIFIIAVGTYTATLCYKFYFNLNELNIDLGTVQFQVIYVLILVSVAIIIFLRSKEVHQDVSELLVADLRNKMKERDLNIIRALNYQEEFIQAMHSGCIDVFNEVADEIKSIDDSNLIKVEDNFAKLKKLIKRLRASSEYLLDRIDYVKNTMHLKPSKIKILDHVLAITGTYESLNSNKRNFIVENKLNAEIIECDEKLINKTIKECIEHSMKYSNDEVDIILSLENSELIYDVEFTNYKEKKDSVKILISTYTTNLSLHKIQGCLNPTFEDVDSIPFIEVNKIIKAHFGNFTLTLNKTGCITYCIEIPLILSKARPKSLDLADFISESLQQLSALYGKQQEMEKIESATKLYMQGMNELDIVSCLSLSRDEREKFLRFIENL